MSDYRNVIKSFTCGLLAGLACFPALRYYRKWRLPTPKKIQSAVLPMLRANADIRKMLGTSLEPGLLSTHSYQGGYQWKSPRFNKTDSLKSLIPFSYKPSSIRLLFQIIGDKSAGMVSLEMTSGATNRYDLYKYMIIDFNDGQRLILKGDEKSIATSQEYKEL